MSEEKIIAIINPRAGGYDSRRQWPSVSKRLEKQGFACEQVFTEKAGQAEELARDAADKGYRYVLAVGGDGTINEVANGILNSPNRSNAALGIVSTGTTCSLARSLSIPRDFGECCSLLVNRKTMAMDVGVVEYADGGRRARRYFINEADVGLGATVVEAARKYRNYLGRSINYLPHVVGGLTSLVSYRNKQVTLLADGKTEVIRDCAMIVAANGAHFGGGMRIAPDARPDDGWLDIVIFADMNMSELFLKVWPMTYNGKHVDHNKVRTMKVKKVTVECEDTILVEADGELLGEGPVSFSVEPAALNILV